MTRLKFSIVDATRRKASCSTAACASGEGDGYPHAAERMRSTDYQVRFRRAVREGLADVKAGRVISDQELEAELARLLGPSSC